MGGASHHDDNRQRPGCDLARTFQPSPAHTPLPENDKALLTSVLIFKERRDIDRAIFMSTPHRE